MNCKFCGKVYDVGLGEYCSMSCWYVEMQEAGMDPDISRLPNGKFMIVVKGGSRRRRKKW